MRYVFLIFFFSLATTIYFSETADTTTVSPVNPLSNDIGTPCSTNASNVWLDIFLVVDVSSSARQKDLQKLGTILSNVFESIFIGNFTKHNTKVGLLTYTAGCYINYNLNDISDSKQLNQILLNLAQYYSPDSTGSGTYCALQNAYNILTGVHDYRKKAVIWFDATNPVGLYYAQCMKNAGISVITIADDGVGSALANNLGNASSPGMNFSLFDPDLAQKFRTLLTQVNCFCPPSYYQLKVFNATSNTTTFYADCFHAYGGNTSPDVAKQFCDPDVLVSVTSSTKLNFLIDNVIAQQMPGSKNFTTGAVRSNIGSWNWQNYNNTQYPFGSFPNTKNASNGDIGYFSNYYGFNWQFRSGGSGDDDARPFICQTHAYDADYLGDLGK